MQDNVGTIVIGTKVETSDATKKMLQLQKEAEMLDAELTNLENKKVSLEEQWQEAGAGAKKYREEIAKSKAEITSLQNKINEINDIRADRGWIDADQISIIEANKQKISQIREEIEATNKVIAKEIAGQDQIGFAIDRQQQAIERKKFALEKVNSKLEIAREKVELENQDIQKTGVSFASIEKNASKVANKFSDMLKKVGRIAMALVGVRTIINLITRSFNTLAQYNEELGTKMEQMRLVLAVALEPVINWLVSMLHTILSLINQISIALSGINLFGRASELWTQKMAKNMGGASGSAKELKKQLAGFDEMNVLQDNQASGGGGGGGSTTQPWTLEPMIDWSKFDIHKIMDKAKEIVDGLIKGINNFLQNVSPEEIADGISTFIIGTLDIITKIFTELDWQKLGKTIVEIIANLDWAGILKSLVENIIGSLTWPIDLIIGLLDGLVEILDQPDFLEKLVKTGAEFGIALLKGLWTLVTKIVELAGKILEVVINLVGKILKFAIELLSAIVETIKEWVTKAWNFVKGIFQTAWNWIISLFEKLAIKTLEKVNYVKNFLKGFADGIKLGIEQVKQFALNIIQTIVNGIKSKIEETKTGIHNVVEWIKDRFNSIVGFFQGIGIAIGDFFSGAIKGAVNGVLSWVESKVNWFINAINNVIKLINKIPGVSIGRLSRISLPRLATGGIINQPGRGVPVGGAIAGESGREGILPLTDKQAMAELGREIGKWISIQATVPVNIGNRQVARVIQELNNDREFAMNS